MTPDCRGGLQAARAGKLLLRCPGGGAELRLLDVVDVRSLLSAGPDDVATWTSFTGVWRKRLTRDGAERARFWRYPKPGDDPRSFFGALPTAEGVLVTAPRQGRIQGFLSR